MSLCLDRKTKSVSGRGNGGTKGEFMGGTGKTPSQKSRTLVFQGESTIVPMRF